PTGPPGPRPPLEGRQGGDEGVDDGLVTHRGRPQLLDGIEAGSKRQQQVLRTELLFRPERLTQIPEPASVEGAGGAADREHERSPHRVQDLPRRLPPHPLEFGHRGREAPVEVDPVVGVADRRIELGQVVALVPDQEGKLVHPLEDERSTQGDQAVPRGRRRSPSGPSLPHLSTFHFSGPACQARARRRTGRRWADSRSAIPNTVLNRPDLTYQTERSWLPVDKAATRDPLAGEGRGGLVLLARGEGARAAWPVVSRRGWS